MVSFQGYYLASFHVSNSSCDGIGVMEISSAGASINGVNLISTANVSSSSPALAAMPDGTASCVWHEEHWNGSELFLLNDVTFERPDLDRLLQVVQEATDDQDLEHIYLGENDLSQDLVELIETIDAANGSAALGETRAHARSVGGGASRPSDAGRGAAGIA